LALDSVFLCCNSRKPKSFIMTSKCRKEREAKRREKIKGFGRKEGRG
jgi:hypothetical protein